jgi:hypothetical protein
MKTKTNIKKTFAFLGATYIAIGVSLITPAPAQAATAQDFLNMFDFLKKYVVDLDKLTNPAPAPAPVPETESTPTVPEPNPDDELNWNN